MGNRTVEKAGDPLLTPVERRRLAVELADSPQTGPRALAVARAALKILEDETDVMGLYFRKKCSEEKDARRLTALVKPVGDRCNLQCRYCPAPLSGNTSSMPETLLDRIISQILEHFGGMEFIFHGGEPLLAGREFFEKAMEYQQRAGAVPGLVRNHVQTNGVLLDDEWCRFFSERDFHVSVSIDGPGRAHDENRVDASGRPSSARVLQGIDCLRRHNARFTLIAVVAPSPSVPPRELYDFICSLGPLEWRANPCRSPDAAGGFSEYAEGLFEAWLDDRGGTTLSMVRDALRGLLGYAPLTCNKSGTCSDLIGFEPDGVVKPCCERPMERRFHFGNIMEQPLDRILNGPAARRFWESLERGRERCRLCDWWMLCHGGCTYQRLQFGGDPGGMDYMCPSYRDLFRRLAGRIDRLLLDPASV